MTAAVIKTLGVARGTVLVENVSKRFDLQQRYRSSNWRDALSGRAGPGAAQTPSGEFWALNDVSFCIEPGTALGIVGHNGSGKSTMLKLLTGIMKPTRGSIQVGGRVGALIEVGAGFHPDLTGRENIYLNGSILGLSRHEIARKFDRIVSFAGLEQFIDTPVKRYSSGMYMRLGFSIAAHTEPDVLLIDEVLAVGDQQFQNRCLNTLRQFVAGGGTAILVSHAMKSVAQLCPQCVWLDRGVLRLFGPTDQAVEQYMAVVAEREEEEFKRNFPEEWAMREREREEAERETRKKRDEERSRIEAEQKSHEAEHRAAENALHHGETQRQREAQKEEERREERRRQQEAARRADSSQPCLLGGTLLGGDGKPQTHFYAGETLTARIAYRVPAPRANLVIGFEIYRDDGLYMFAASNYQYDLVLDALPLQGEIDLHVPFLSLNEGTYRLRLSLFPDPDETDETNEWQKKPEHVIENAATFTVSAGALRYGCAFLPVEWKVAPAAKNEAARNVPVSAGQP